METEVQVYASEIKNPQPLSIQDVRKNTKLVKQILREAMVEKVDFGLIPGCGDKPSLFKPGAEKLMLLFKLGAFPEVTDLSTSDSVRYLVKTKIVHLPSGTELGIGVGDCSSDEDKYKWRASVCDEEFNSLPEERKRLKWKKGWDGKPATSVKQVRTNPADISNTVLKMAKKRSVIDGVISATAASDILTQDLEDMNPEVLTGSHKPSQGKPSSEGNGHIPDDQLGNWVLPCGNKYKGLRLTQIMGQTTESGKAVGREYLEWMAENWKEEGVRNIVTRFLKLMLQEPVIQVD